MKDASLQEHGLPVLEPEEQKFLYHSKCKGNKFQLTWNGSRMMGKCVKCGEVILLLKLNSSTTSWDRYV